MDTNQVVECTTQEEADAAAMRGDVIVWRKGHLLVHKATLSASGSSRVYVNGSSSVSASDSARVSAFDSALVFATDSVSVYAYNSASVYASGSSIVYARDLVRVSVKNSAIVYDAHTRLPLRRDHPRLILGPLGSHDAMLGVSLPFDGSEPIIYADCWVGRLSDFEARVSKINLSRRYKDEFRAAIAYIRTTAAIPQE